MRRRVTMVLTLALPMAVYALSASAKPKAASRSATAPTAASASAAVTAGSAAPTAASAAGPSVPTSAAPPVLVDMNAKPADPGLNGATYSVRLRDLEQRVDELKDQVRRSHTRLALLSDTILGGGGAGSRAEVKFENEMSNAFELTKALFVVDGQVQYSRQDDSGALADQKQIPIYSGNLPPGDHTIQLDLTFQGNGFGVFSYLRGYKFEVKSGHPFTVGEGKALVVTALAYEKGGVTTPLDQRPTIEWREKVQPLSATSAQASAPASEGPSVPAGGALSGTLSVGGSKK